MNKRNRIFSFVFSLVPGLGQMYIGMMRRGVSMLFAFCALFALSMYLQIEWALFFLPVLWAYGFFDFWNLVRMDSDDFAELDDMPFWGEGLGLDKMRYSIGIGVAVIIVGFYALIRSMSDFLSRLFPEELYWWMIYDLPQMLVAVAMIVIGVWLIVHKKRRMDCESVEEDANIDFLMQDESLAASAGEEKSEEQEAEGADAE